MDLNFQQLKDLPMNQTNLTEEEIEKLNKQNEEMREKLQKQFNEQIEKNKEIAKTYLISEGFNNDILTKAEKDLKLIDALLLYFHADRTSFEIERLREEARTHFICNYFRK